MTRIILSTGNIMEAGPAISQRSIFEKSNMELVNGIKANLQAAQQDFEALDPPANGHAPPVAPDHPQIGKWWSQQGDILYLPDIDSTAMGLAEDRPQYDITVKLFFLPTTDLSKRGSHTEDAINLVLKQLAVPSIDLLIISFPNIAFDADDDEIDDDEGQNAAGTRSENIALTWETLEALHQRGIIRQIGVSEFGTERLKTFLPRTRVRPSVDQINVRDCCVVPKSLIMFAKQEKIELLTHNDCTNVLPKGTIRELLEPLTSELNGTLPDDSTLSSVRRELEPQWVIKYTAVVSDRGVIENKGYFAMAEARD